MKEEHEITQEVRALLESLEQHGQNDRRQKELSDLIDRLERKTENGERNPEGLTDRMGGKTFHSPLSTFHFYWWIVGAAAACLLLLWLLARPAWKETPNVEEKHFAEEVLPVDTAKSEEKHVVKEPFVEEKLLAEEQEPVEPRKTENKVRKPIEKPVEKTIEAMHEEPLLAETTPTEPIDTSNIGSNTIPNVPEDPIAVQSPQRRVIRSLNLVCYECQKEPEYTPNSSLLTPHFEKTIFGQPQDPNMKNGSLAFEVKLH